METIKTLLLVAAISWMVGAMVAVGEWTANASLPRQQSAIVHTSILVHQAASDLEENE